MNYLYLRGGYIPFIFITLVLSSCSQSSQDSAVTPNCYSAVNGNRLFIGEPDCYRSLPSERISGIWVLDHEYSIFYDNISSIDTDADPADLTWLEINQRETPRPLYGGAAGRRRAYYIDFIGKRSREPGLYGHLGIYGRGIFVERVISISPVPLSS